MKSLLVMSFLLASTCFADQAATLRCEGENVILKVKTSYLGDSKQAELASQSLYVLTTNKNEDESSNTAYFLKTTIDVGKFGNQIHYGENEANGSFELEMSRPVDVSDGTVIKKESYGTLNYSHGPLKGNDVNVKCITE